MDSMIEFVCNYCGEEITEYDAQVCFDCEGEFCLDCINEDGICIDCEKID